MPVNQPLGHLFQAASISFLPEVRLRAVRSRLASRHHQCGVCEEDQLHPRADGKHLRRRSGLSSQGHMGNWARENGGDSELLGWLALAAWLDSWLLVGLLTGWMAG